MPRRSKVTLDEEVNQDAILDLIAEDVTSNSDSEHSDPDGDVEREESEAEEDLQQENEEENVDGSAADIVDQDRSNSTIEDSRRNLDDLNSAALASKKSLAWKASDLVSSDKLVSKKNLASKASNLVSKLSDLVTSKTSNLGSKRNLSSDTNARLASKRTLTLEPTVSSASKRSLSSEPTSSVASKRSLTSERTSSLAFKKSLSAATKSSSNTSAKSASSRNSLSENVSARSSKSLSARSSKRKVKAKKSKSMTKSRSSSRSIAAPESLLEEQTKCTDSTDNRPVYDVLHEFGSEINKSMTCKRRKVEKFTKQCDEARQKLDFLVENQKNKRAMLYEEFNKAVQLLMGEWDKDMERIKCGEEKLKNLWNQQSKIFTQTKTAQAQRYKAMKNLHNEFITSLARMESGHNDQQQAAMKTSSRELSALQQKFVNEVNNRDYTAVRKSLQSLLQK